ncbi:MAG: hypothetical protein JRJ87_14195 [Deltaproteobacteria bacterium]|nr:hypothetical protein [Deltaproteobacteria bacterium]
MNEFTQNEFEIFLVAVDRHLAGTFSLIIIDGCAAALAYQVERPSLDIDTWSETSDIEDACRAARQETGLQIPLHTAAIADPPYHFEDRLVPLDIHSLSNLKIYVPEKHDLVLMKVVRGDEHDLETIKEIAEKNGLDLEVLVTRFLKEMQQAIGRPETLKHNFLAAIERVFGEDIAEQTERRLN